MSTLYSSPGLGRSGRTRTHCLVCGFAEVRTDEVVERGLVQLNECPHCEHRWTASLGAAPARSVPLRRPAGIRTAA